MFGWLNDVLVMVQYFLALPVAVALHTLLRPRNARLSRLTLAIGISGMLVVVVLRLLLVVGALTFRQQIVPVVIALLIVGGGS
jgi:archaellum biogenesis protein FlaJ (TadC family)